MLGSCNSRSNGSIKFEDFCNLIRDPAAQKASIEKVRSCSTVAYELEKNPRIRLDHVTGCYMNLSRSPAKFRGHFTILTSQIRPVTAELSFHHDYNNSNQLTIYDYDDEKPNFDVMMLLRTLIFIMTSTEVLLKVIKVNGTLSGTASLIFSFLPPFPKGSTLKRKNLLPLEQILSLKS